MANPAACQRQQLDMSEKSDQGQHDCFNGNNK
jgi:hypothetical protein